MKIAIIFFTIFFAMARSQTALEELSTGIEKLTFKLFKEAVKAKPNESIVFSPFSLLIIMALTRAGSNGLTNKELTSVLNLPSEKKTIEAVKQFQLALKKNTDDLKLVSANKLYLEQSFQILDSFKTIAVDSFKAGIENVDFSQSEQAANIINKWVEQQTNNKIKNLIDPKILTDLTRLVLVNALYFSGKWLHPFNIKLTKKEKFYTSNTQCKQVDMMYIEEYFRYYECQKSDAKFIELLYKGGNASMIIVLPNKREGLRTLDIEHVFSEIKFERKRTALSLPRFLTESTFDMKKMLENIGLTTIFSNSADLSRISDTVSLKVSAIVQKAFINVSENGTEAAAATAVGIVTTSIPPEPEKFFKVDHPFLYYIKFNGVLLFTGSVVS